MASKLAAFLLNVSFNLFTIIGVLERWFKAREMFYDWVQNKWKRNKSEIEHLN